MTSAQSIQWLEQVGGHLYRARRKSRGLQPWVAVVRVPGVGSRNGRLIIALGDSAEEATAAAEEKWQTLWGRLSTMH